MYGIEQVKFYTEYWPDRCFNINSYLFNSQYGWF